MIELILVTELGKASVWVERRSSRLSGRAPLKFQRPECDPCCSKGVRCNNSDRETRDEGRVEANMVFTYLDAFDEDHIAVEDLNAVYIRSGLGDRIVKKRLDDVLQALLAPIRDRPQCTRS
jgi:hypothetical protein